MKQLTKFQLLRISVAVMLAMACTVTTAQEPLATTEDVAKWRAAAEQGDALAQNNLGNAYWDAQGVAEDKREAVRWYRKAADQGFAKAQANLGWAYANGAGVVEDKREAVRWYRKAADQGNAWAQSRLGYAYSQGEGAVTDKREALNWYRKAAEQGNARAQFRLGDAYWDEAHSDFKDVVAEDKRMAVSWYRKAAEQGLWGAQTKMGDAYWHGQGVAADKRVAADWYGKAVEGGLKEAEQLWNLSRLENFDTSASSHTQLSKGAHSLLIKHLLASLGMKVGDAYWNGDDVAVDKREAVRWYRVVTKIKVNRSASSALEKLGDAYWNGDGVVADEREAYIWWFMAAESGNEAAAEKLGEREWRKFLSKSEIKAAKKEAAQRQRGN